MLRVADVMTRRLITLEPCHTLKDARETMEVNGIRHLLVVTSKNEFVGLVTHRDVLRASVSQFADLQKDIREQIESGIPISESMQTQVLTVSPQTALPHAAELLLAHKYGCLPVLEESTLCGILTESDFVRLSISLLREKYGTA